MKAVYRLVCPMVFLLGMELLVLGTDAFVPGTAVLAACLQAAGGADEGGAPGAAPSAEISEAEGQAEAVSGHRPGARGSQGGTRSGGASSGALYGTAAASDSARPVVDPPGLTRLDPRHPVWIDPARRRVVMLGRICLRRGQLEMFACLRGSKEHESIVSVPAEALDVHAALVALGAEAGHPVRFMPEYRPAEGTEIEVTLFWTDSRGTRRTARAQEWLRRSRPYYWLGDEPAMTRAALHLYSLATVVQPIEHPWVFGGSGFWADEESGERYYLAESGDFICVSNFPSAMLDLPIESSTEAGHLVFEAFTPRIPPLGTLVTVVLTPKEEPEAAKEGGETTKEGGETTKDTKDTKEER